ncbi:MAG: ABC-2 family transporter protein [Candidatus Marsarchaeota archaeon]|nr:ABC-2 family transporter protein [Candidatus Marsarchaeota archaeon]
MDNPYIAFFKISIKDSSAYFKDYLTYTIGRILTYMLMIFVWNIVYIGGHLSEIGSFSLMQIDAYFVIGGAIFLIIDSKNDKILSDDIKTGNIAKSLIKPVNYVYMVFLESLADNVLVLPPVFITIIFALYYLGISTSILSIITFIIIVLIGYAIINVIQFIIGSLSIYTTSAFGMSILLANVAFILGGAIMPLTFFPSYMSNIVLLLPFQMFIYVPTSILIGIIPSSAYLYYILFGLFWLLMLSVLGYFLWGHVKKKISSAGG